MWSVTKAQRASISKGKDEKKLNSAKEDMKQVKIKKQSLQASKEGKAVKWENDEIWKEIEQRVGCWNRRDGKYLKATIDWHLWCVWKRNVDDNVA